MKRFYNWFHLFYGMVETNLSHFLDQALDAPGPEANRFAEDSVLGWACGSGGLGYKQLPRAKKKWSPETERKILARSLAHARKGVVIIDHEQRYQPLVALVERFEGSHYRQFLELDLEAVSRFLGVQHRSLAVPGLTVVEFLK